jgi:putative spermidine/putrescine transport system ATP-binding protein
VEVRPVGVGLGERCVVAVRPERIAVAAVPAEDLGADALPATLIEASFRGDHFRLRLYVGAPDTPTPAEVIVKRPAAAPLSGLAPGQPAALAWQPRHAFAFAPEENP